MQEGEKARTAVQTVFHAVFGAFHAGFIEKEGEIWYFQGGRIPPPVSKKEEFHMKQTTLTQRLAAARVALCRVLSVCAPALAAEPDGDWTSEYDKNS